MSKSNEPDKLVEITITIKKKTLKKLRKIEDKYCATAEDMISIEAEKLLMRLGENK